jgi:lipopolysaccharide/colanic/teichoic acid biosynthesis glycosyltransferase
MTSVIVSTVENYDLVAPQNQIHSLSHYKLQWRRGQLLVKCAHKLTQPYLPSLNDEKLLVNCLKHSPVNLVSIDGKLGETWLKFWAEACEKAHKPIFLSRPIHRKLPKSSNWCGKLIDWILAFVFLLLTSPVMLGLVILMKINSSEPLFTYEWRVGEKGKLFRAIKFCTTSQNNFKFLRVWLNTSALNHFSKLWNVLRGEMSLTGDDCWTLAEAVLLSLEEQPQANKPSMITSSLGVQVES